VEEDEMGGACSTNVENMNVYRLLVKKSEKERYRLEHQDVGGWIILRWILERWDAMVWTGLVWLRAETGGELL
jgi:hypothetical protein